ncbi:hypothetical protein NHX12_025336 [Muraenolepis orangiensis]|uniref:Monocarboxylate transporter 7 n=1 Tax=Muraenolepis orangiensis TaxID=630683 RepID=A0A9Q0EI09_9TELE|nr:hypothetical protein NHX12_025336 [Muraenolepis orangiensis]
MASNALRGCNLFRPNEYREVPDGGWGWLVAVAFFLVEMFTYGTIKSFGIFLQDLVEEFGESNSKVSWVLSICVFVMTFMAPLSSVLTNRFGFQPVVMLGGALIATGTITSAFTSSINEMYITTGLVAGLGYCLTFLPTVTILSQYFDRRRSLVIAVASMGESVAMFALAPSLAALKSHVGWRRTMVVMGALQGIVVVCGALLRPIVIKPAETNGDSLSSLDSGTKLLDFSVLREGSFICYSLFGLFATLGFFAPPLYVVELSVSCGVARKRAAYMLSVMAVAEVFGRLSVGWLMSRPGLQRRKLRLLLGCVVAMTLVLFSFTLVWEFYGVAVCCAAFGALMGSISCTHIPLLAEDQVVGIQRMASAAGVYVFIQSFAGLAGPPLGGFLVDMTHNYGSAFYSCTAGMALGALFLGLVPTAKRWSPCGTPLRSTDEETPQGGPENTGSESRTQVSKPSGDGTDTERKPSQIAVEVDQNQQ